MKINFYRNVRRRRIAKKLVKRFNKKHPLGTLVRFWELPWWVARGHARGLLGIIRRTAVVDRYGNATVAVFPEYLIGQHSSLIETATRAIDLEHVVPCKSRQINLQSCQS